MTYTELSILFYSDKGQYESEYNIRVNSPKTVKLNFSVL